MSPPIELWFWPTPNGWKISIALEEMALPYELKPVNIGAGEQFTDAFLKLSPNGRMPAILDHGADGKPLSIFESGAVLQHLGRKSGRFYPQEERARAEVEQWLFWQVGGLGPMCGQTHHFRQYAPRMLGDSRHTAYGAARYTNEANRLYGVLDHHLEQGRDYVAGDYSIADMAIWPWIYPHRNQGQTLEDFPSLKAWFERVGAREGVKRGMKVGEQYRSNTMSDNSKEADRARAILFGQRDRNPNRR